MPFRHAYDPIRALGAAWGLVTKAPLTLLVGGFLLFFTDFGGVAGAANVSEDARHLTNLETALLTMFACVACVIALAVLLFNCWIRVGYALAVERVMTTQREDLADLFRGGNRFVSMVLTQLLIVLISIVAALPFGLVGGVALVLRESFGAAAPFPGVIALGGALLYLPVFVYVLLGVSLACNAVAVEGMQPTEAISRSWSLVRGHRLPLIVYLIVVTVVELLGFCLCCVGAIGTYTLVETGKLDSYMRLVRGGEPESWPKPAASA